MVKNGFSIEGLKRMYLDEFFEYYKEVIYFLEQSGQIEKGSYSKLTKVDESADEMFNLFSNFKKNHC
jgi:hypothetical protein